MTAELMGIKGKDGHNRMHCSACGRFISFTNHRRYTGPPFKFPKNIDKPFAGRHARYVADAVCSQHGILEDGLILGIGPE